MQQTGVRNPRSRSQSSIQRSAASSVIGDGELVELSKIEKQVNAQAKLAQLMARTGSELATANYQSALQSVEQSGTLAREAQLPPDKAAFVLTICHLNNFVSHFSVGRLGEAEAALERAKNALGPDSNFVGEEFEALYMRILTSYLILRFSQGDLEGLTEVKELIKDFLSSEETPNSSMPVFMWHMGLLLGAETYTTQDAQDPRGARILGLFHAIHLELTGAMDKAREEYYDFIKFAKTEKMNELMLVALKRVAQVEAQNPASLAQVQKFSQDSLQEIQIREPDFPNRFSKFEAMFEALMELGCLVQVVEGLKFEGLSTFRAQLNPEYIRSVAKFMLRQTILKIQRAKTGYYKSTESEIGPRVTFGVDQGSQQPGRVQSAEPLKKQPMSDMEIIRMENQKSPWIHLEPLRELVGSVRGGKNSADEVSAALQNTIAMINKEESTALLATLAQHPAIRSYIQPFEKAVEDLATACTRLLIFQPFRAIKAVARFRQRGSQNPSQVQLNSGVLPSVPRNGSVRSIPPRVTPAFVSGDPRMGSQMRVASERAFAMPATNFLLTPEAVTKLNYTSSGKMTKYFVILGGVNLRWADKAEHLANPKLCHTVPLASLRGVTYGKVTKTFAKSGNKRLESWLCFSLINAKKSVDLYASETRINPWMMTLSAAVKNANPMAYCLRPGQFLWRKLKLVFEYFVVSQIPPKQLKKFKRGISFCRLILLYKIYEKNLRSGTAPPPSFVQRK